MTVEFQAARCDNCHCGRMFSSPSAQIQFSLAQESAALREADGLQVGQQVVLSVGKPHFSRVALLLFGLPLVGGFVAVGGTLLAGGGTGWQVLALVGGVLTGAVAARTLRWQMQTTVSRSLAMIATDS